eukprot:CFRG3122T1
MDWGDITGDINSSDESDTVAKNKTDDEYEEIQIPTNNETDEDSEADEEDRIPQGTKENDTVDVPKLPSLNSLLDNPVGVPSFVTKAYTKKDLVNLPHSLAEKKTPSAVFRGTPQIEKSSIPVGTTSSAPAAADSSGKRLRESTDAPLTFQQKEKRKRDLGMASRGKNYVEEEKRILRQSGFD